MRRLSLVMACLLAIAPAAVGATDRFVSVQGDDAGNDCLTGSAPCLTIGHALTQAMTGDVLKVTTGRYDESLLLDASIVLTLSGSWAPDFGSRDTASRGSKLLGMLHVEAGLGEVVDVTVDGFLLTNDSGVRAETTDDGGLTVRLASTGIDFNRFEPGIIASASGTSTLSIEATDTSVSSNRVLVTSQAAINLFSTTTGGMTLAMTDSAVERNFAGTYGTPGIRASATGALDIVLTRTRVDRNRGSGLELQGFGTASVNVALIDSSASRNRSPGLIWAGVDLSITNSVIARNQSVGLAMESQTEPGTLQAVNSTIRGNRFRCGDNPSCAAGIWVDGPLATVDLRNTIFWGNRAPGGAADVFITSGATVNVDHSDIGELTGAYNDLGGNISADPLFVSRRDAHLNASSLAIDAGTCTGAPATDFEGDPRPTGAGCDMGADEYVP